MSARNDAADQDGHESRSGPEQGISTLSTVESPNQATSTNATSTARGEVSPSDQSNVVQTIRPYQAPGQRVDTPTALNSGATEEAKDDSPSSPSSFASGASGAHPTFGSPMTYSPVPTLTTGASTDDESIRTGSISHVGRMQTGPNRIWTRRDGMTAGTIDEVRPGARARVTNLRRAATDPNRLRLATTQGALQIGLGLHLEGLVMHDDPTGLEETAVTFAGPRVYNADEDDENLQPNEDNPDI